MLILNEMYFGKLPGLLKLEEFISKLRKVYDKSELIRNPSEYRELLKDPILTKMAKEVSELFGLNECAITIARDWSMNAYTLTYPVTKNGVYDSNEHLLEPKKMTGSIIITNDGFSFNKRKFPTNILICLNLGLLFGKYTEPEVVAVLLHEIGHSFSKFIVGYDLSSRSDEQFADQFATMYGYGKELISALSSSKKTEFYYGNIENKLKDVPVFNIFIGIKKVIESMYEDQFETDEHPDIRDRITYQIKQLEDDLKHTPNLTPTMKKDIENKIKICKDLLNRYENRQNSGMAEKMGRFYNDSIRDNIPEYKKKKKEAEKATNPTTINNTINSIYNKKGYFRIY